jgi:hypothetical protein
MGIANYIESEIASKAVGFQKFATYFVLQRINIIIDKYMTALKSNELVQDLFDDSGKVDIDALYHMSKKAIQKSGQITMLGVILGESDIDKIYSFIRS